MQLENSSIGRLMLVVLTIAIGFAAMKTQSDFLKGCLVTLAAGWILRSLAGATSGQDRHRGSSIAFLLVASISLFAGFGPLSDTAARNEIFTSDSATGAAKRLNAIWPTTVAFLRLSHFLRPRERAWIVAIDLEGKAIAEIVMTADRGVSPDVEDVTEGLLQDGRHGRGGILTNRRNSQPFRLKATRLTLDNYLQACYILISLGAGALASVCVLGFRRNGPPQPI